MASKKRSAKPQEALPVRPAVPAWLWNWFWLFLGAFVLSLAVFGRSLGGGFVFDDYHLPFMDPRAAQMPAAFWIGGARPLLTATYWSNFLLSGTDAFYYHLTGLAIHAATTVLVFFVLDRLFDISGFKTNRCWYALFGAAIFLLHPLQTESVDYIAGRSELVAGFFLFAGWLVFLRSFESKTGIVTVLGILILAGAGLLGKESAISLPAILIATDVFWAKDGLVAQFRRRWKLYVPFVVGALGATVLILRTLGGGSATGATAGVSPLSYALTQCRVIPTYIRLFLVPVGQNGDWGLPFFHSLVFGGAWLYVLLMLALLAVTGWLYFRNRLAAFGLIVFLLALAPTSSIVPIRDALAERRMYVPIAGLILTALALVLDSRLSVSALRNSAVAIVAILGLISCARGGVWTSDVAFWRDSTEKNPDNGRAHFGLGSALVKAHNCAAAIPSFEIARSKEPANAQFAWDLATAYQCHQDPERALVLYRTLAAAQPTAATYDQIGYIEATQGRVPQSLDAIENALRLDPNDATAYAYRGLARLALDDTEHAEADFRHALQIDPTNEAASKGLAALAARRQ
jgi:protein O-mannosyl-transferase